MAHGYAFAAPSRRHYFRLFYPQSVFPLSHQAVGLWVEGISKALGVQFVTYIWMHQPLARKKHVIITHKMLIGNDLASVCLLSFCLPPPPLLYPPPLSFPFFD